MKKTVSIVGLGYVGLPLACLCARKGHTVFGIDTNKGIVEKTNRNESHIDDDYLKESIKGVRITATTDYAPVSDSDIVIVCVPTPVDKKHLPDLAYVVSASESIGRHLKKGQTIVIESTISPGTVENVVLPILEKSGLSARKDFYLSHCPERIDPGNRKWHIEDIPRVCGGVTPEATAKTAEFYRSILNGNVTELKSVKAAEAVKIMENTFRDVNIAFINEMAKSFDRAGIDILEVIRGASTKPFSFMAHYPGCGVGGHCISVDPYYLIEEAKTYGFDHQFLVLARKINNSMPEYAIDLFTEELNKLEKSVKGAKVGLLGLAYKGNVDDIRESPALEMLELLTARGAEVLVYDPYIYAKSTVHSLSEVLEKADYLIIATDHNEFKKITSEMLKKNNIKVVVDGRNILDKDRILSEGILYKGIGR